MLPQFSGADHPMNRHGLSVTVPAEIKRQVRQECGFGCVFCGLAIADYHHFDPEFCDATVHDPQKIALVCPTHHGHLTRRMWSNDGVAAARRAPKTFRKGCAHDCFDIREPFELFVGKSRFRDVRCVVRKASTGDEWFSIQPAEAPGAPPRISAKFYASNGVPELEIDRNEWRCSTDVWDLEIEGPRIVVRRRHGEPTLRLRARPPHGLEIEYLKMSFGDAGIEVQSDGTVLLTVAGTTISTHADDVLGGDVVFSVP